MKILITYYSKTNNTKKVSEITKEKLSIIGHKVELRNVLTVKRDQVESADILVIGTPIHGKILFGQKHAKELDFFLQKELPNDLLGKPVLIFATFMFFPRNGLKKLKNRIETNNGKVINILSQKRNKKELLATQIVECVSKI